MQIFGETIRGYIVAPHDNNSAFSSNPWFSKYEARRNSMYCTWKLRGGISCSDHVRECFDWKDYDAWRGLLRQVAMICVADGQCVLSELSEDLKSQLTWSWILKWARDGSKSILVGNARNL